MGRDYRPKRCGCSVGSAAEPVRLQPLQRKANYSSAGILRLIRSDDCLFDGMCDPGSLFTTKFTSMHLQRQRSRLHPNHVRPHCIRHGFASADVGGNAQRQAVAHAGQHDFAGCGDRALAVHCPIPVRLCPLLADNGRGPSPGAVGSNADASISTIRPRLSPRSSLIK